MLQLVAHLAELDTRDLHLREGFPSLFIYCRDVLGLSEHEAYNRIEAARAARRFPVILDRLAQGVLNLTTVRLLAPHLTSANHQEVLDSARGKRKPEVEEIVARLAPRPDVGSVVRKLPTPAGHLPANVQLRCRCHNILEARVFFGPARAYVGGGFVGDEANSF